MTSLTRRQLVASLVAGLLAGAMGVSVQAGIVSSLNGEDPLVVLLFGESNSQSWQTSGMSAPVHQDDSEKPRQPQWPELLPLLAALGMQAGQSAGMSGTSLSITGSSSSNSQAALIGAPLDLSDPPLRDRVLDEARLIIPLGPLSDLLRPA